MQNGEEQMIKQLHNETEPLVLLKYFNIFRHPLRLDELYKFSGGTETRAELELYLNELVAARTITRIGDYYLYDGDEKHIEKREKGERFAASLLPAARKTAK